MNTTTNGTTSSSGDYVTYSSQTDPAQISNFSQSLSIRNGVVQTNLTWNPSATAPASTAELNTSASATPGGGVQLQYTAYAHRSRPNVGVLRLDISGLPTGTPVLITDAIDGAAAQRVENGSAGIESSAQQVLYSSVQPAGVSNVTAWLFSALSVVASGNTSVSSTDAWTNVTAHPTSVLNIVGTGNTSTSAKTYAILPNDQGIVSIVKYAGLASSDAFSPNERATALGAAVDARTSGWDSLLSEHSAAWEQIWNQGGDVIIHNDKQDPLLDQLQTTARASFFHLLSNVRNGSEGPGLGDQSIPPAGLTSDSYAAGIFWDAELWMYPPLLALHPDYSRSINQYRTKNLGRSVENVKPFSNYSGALYPWVSFRYGNCTGIGPCADYEYHLNNDIAIAQWQYYQQTGNRTFLQSEAWPILSNVSTFWASKVIPSDDGQSYIALNMTDPDEYANFQDNGAFTNAGTSKVLLDTIEAAKILGYEDQVPANWSEIATKIKIETTNNTDKPITLEFTGYNASLAVKQADVVLLTYPLEFSRQPDPLADLDFYSGATSPNGPGMTYSIFSIDAAQLAVAGCESYTYLRSSYEPYSRAPYVQFSEQTSDLYALNGGTNPAYTFLTGHGGFLQTLTHGFTGFRARTDRFYLDPSLPPQLAAGGGITVKAMQYQGNAFDVALGPNETVVTLVSGPGATVEIASRNAKAGNYTLQAGGEVRVPTRRVDLAAPAVAGNFAQCQPASSNVSWVPGNFDIAAFDGSNATVWQPNTVNASEITVDLGAERTVSRLNINWSRNPAMTMMAYAGNNTADDVSTLIVNSTSVNISSPYDPATVADVVLPVGNITQIELASPVQARYVRLVVEGAATPDAPGHGATVAELNVL